MIGRKKPNPKVHAEISSLNEQIADLRRWREDARKMYQVTDDEFVTREKELVEKRLALHNILSDQD